MAKKVGGAGSGKSGNPEKVKKTRSEYPVPVGGIPEGTPTDFDPKIHKPLKKKDFKTQGGFMNYRADVYDRAAARYAKAATRLRDQAKISGQFSPEAEKQMKKAKKAAEQYAEMIKQLKAQGINLNDVGLGEGVDAPAAETAKA